MRLDPKDTVLIVMDLQEKLFNAMPETRNDMLRNCRLLIKAASLLKMPIVVTNQYPKGLGQTVSGIKEVLPDNAKFFEKVEFSCVDNKSIAAELKKLRRKSVIICGVETHVCVYQSARDLSSMKFSVFVPVDAVHSRRKLDWKIGTRLIEKTSAIATTESVVFDLLKKAGTPEFKDISRFMKENR